MEGFARSIAVVIGIDQYRNPIPRLRNAVNDARALARVLEDETRYDNYDEVLLHVDEQADAATLRELLVSVLPERLGEKDRLLFYFAGHGVTKETSEGPVGYLLPQDSSPDNADSFLPMSHVHEALTSLSCKHMLIILDCCFAGAFRWSGTRDISLLPDVVYKERYAGYIHYKAWQVLTSASHTERALDIDVGGTIFTLGQRQDTNGHSPFASALLDGLNGAGDIVPPGAGDGLITANELYVYLRDRFSRTPSPMSPSQTPGLWLLDKDSWGEYVFFVPEFQSLEALRLEDAPPLSPDRNPYRGLEAYKDQDRDQFFAREESLDALTEQVTEQPLTIVVGASGSGKTSVLQAGLLPRLRQSEPSHWEILESIRPGVAPLQALATLQRPSGQNLWQLLEVPDLDASQALASAVSAWTAANPHKKLFLLIDQLEQLCWTTCSAEERERFLALLRTAIQSYPKSMRLVLSVRSDALPSLLPLWRQTGKSPEDTASDDLRSSTFDVPALHTFGDLRRSIEGPAAANVLYFESSDFVEKLLNAFMGNPGAMPLLSLAMSEMYTALYEQWLSRPAVDRALTEELYESFGGVGGLVHDLAQGVYDELDEAQRNTMRRLMLRMLTFEDGKWRAHRVARSELNAVGVDENERVSFVLDRLTQNRLIVQSGSVESGSFVEPAHDALVEEWTPLKKWIDDEQERPWPYNLTLSHDLAQAARGWQEAGQPKNRLWSDRKQANALSQRLREAPALLNQTETEFAQQSIARARFLFRRMAAGIATVVLLVAVVVLGSWAGNARSLRQESETLAQTANTFLERDPVSAVSLALDALPRPEKSRPYEPLPEFFLRRAMQSSLERKYFSVADELLDGQIAFGPYAIAVGGRRLNLVDNALTELVPVLPAGGVARAPTWSDSGTLLYHDGNRLEVRLEGESVANETFDSRVEQASWQPKGDQVAVCTGGGVWLWRPMEGTRASLLHQFVTGSQQCVAWSEDGQHVVAWGGDGSVIIAEPDATASVRASLPAHARLIYSAVWSPDSRYVVTTSADGTAVLRWVQAGHESITLPHDSDVLGAMFLPVEQPSGAGGVNILTWEQEGLAHLWDIHGKHLLTIGEGISGGAIRGAIYHGAERQLLVYTSEGQAQIWDVTTGDRVAELDGHESGKAILDAAWQGDYVATASADGTAKVWESGRGTELVSLDAHAPGNVLGVRWWDAQHLLTYGGDGTIRLWQILGEDDQPLCLGRGRDGLPRCFNTGQSLTGMSDDAKSAHWLDDETLLLTGSGGKAWRWSAGSQGIIDEIKPQPEASDAVWDALGERTFVYQKESMDGPFTDGQVWTAGADTFAPVAGPIRSAFWLDEGLYVSSISGHFRRVDPDTGDILTEYPDRGETIVDAAIYDDWLAAADLNGQVMAWDVTSGEPDSELGVDEERVLNITNLQWDPTGPRLLSAGEGGVRLWDISANTILWTWPATANESRFAARFSPDGRFVAVYVAQELIVLNAVDARELWRTPTAAYADNVRGVEWVLRARWPRQGVYADVTDRLRRVRNRSAWHIEDQQLLLLAWSSDRTVKLWNPAAEEEQIVWQAEHTAPIVIAAVSPKGTYAFTVDQRGAQRLWLLWLNQPDQLLSAAQAAISHRKTNGVLPAASENAKQLSTTSR